MLRIRDQLSVSFVSQKLPQQCFSDEDYEPHENTRLLTVIALDLSRGRARIPAPLVR